VLKVRLPTKTLETTLQYSYRDDNIKNQNTSSTRYNYAFNGPNLVPHGSQSSSVVAKYGRVNAF